MLVSLSMAPDARRSKIMFFVDEVEDIKTVNILLCSIVFNP